jgi:hypothetical protein
VPRPITDTQVEQVIVKTLEETPTDATHWSTRSMAQATGMSQPAVSRIWRASVWTKTADQILDKITRYLQPISNSGH